MTNKEKFVEAFGEVCYHDFIDVAKEANAIDIFEWLLDEYKEPARKFEEFESAASAVMDDVKKDVIKLVEESKRRHDRAGKGYDLKWYIDAVEDFYLGKAKSIEFKLSDDLSSGKKTKSLEGFKTRWKVAVNELDLGEEIWIHKYYAGTCNECICLEKPNFKNSKAAGFTNMR